jgi:predicted HTH domain antitoxin
MTTVEVPVDERWLASTGLNPSEAQHEFRLILAAKLFELRRLTMGQAAEMAGLPVGSFMEALSRLRVSVINLTDEQLAHEFKPA